MTVNRIQPTSEPVRQHTPTPWTLRQFEHSVVLQGPDKIQVMSTSWHGSIRASYPLKAESLANAAFVLEACNSHASLKARVEELEATLKWIEARDRMWAAPEYEKDNEVLERGPHNIKIRGSYGAAANLVLKRAALSRLAHFCTHAYCPFRDWRLAKLRAEHPEIEKDKQPRLVDNDAGEIIVTFNGAELRGWSYKDDAEQRIKMLAAREYVEGWCDGRDTR